MWSLIINTYRQEFKSRLNKTNKFSLWYPPLYFLLVCPYLMIRSEEITPYLFYYSINIPCMLAVFTAMLYDAEISKTFFLVPTSLQDRKKYIIQSGVIRSGFSIALLIILFVVFKVIAPDYSYPYIILLNAAMSIIELNWGEGPDPNRRYGTANVSVGTLLKIIATLIYIVIGMLDKLEIAHSTEYFWIGVINLVWGIIYLIYYIPKIVKKHSVYQDGEEEKKN